MTNPFNKLGKATILFFKKLSSLFVSFFKKTPSFLKKGVSFVVSLPFYVKAVAILSFSLLFVFFSAAAFLKTVTINDENSSSVVYTFSSDTKNILFSFGFHVGEHDEVLSLSSGKTQTVLIKRAFVVKITADGKTTSHYTTGESVGSVLKKAGIFLNEDDLINLPVSSMLTDSTEITIRRVTYSTEVLEESIPYEINQRGSPLIKRAGRVVVLTHGKNGTKEITTKRKLIDGEEVERTVLSEKVTVAPVTQVSLIGTPGVPASPRELPDGITLINGVPSSYKAVYEGRGTAYSSPNHPWLKLGCVAVNLKVIPRGSIVYVTSSDGSFVYGVAVAADTGTSLVSGYTLVDCFFPTYEESCWHGAKTVKVYVLK